MKRILLISGGVILGICMVLIITLLSYINFSDYSQLDSFLDRQNSVTIYDRNMNLVQVTTIEHGKRREFTPLDQIPLEIQKAFIKAEDTRFYEHSGVDYKAALRALVQNTQEMRTVSGASTITMQLARMITPAQERSLYTKFSETLDSYRLEKRLSKDQILELYLNSIPFANNVEGITSAARYFFHKELTELSYAQIYCLAVIPRSPTAYSPLTNPENCAKAASLICEKSYEEILQEISVSESFEWPFHMPHYVEFLKKHYGQDFGKKIHVLHLGADLDVQDYVQYEIFNNFRKAEHARIENAAAIAIENKTGRVLVWIGSKDWYDQEHSGQIDGILVPNQMGSSMKPFLYALALEGTIKPTEILPDIQMDFGNENVYMPLNFNNRFNGPVLLRTALASSLNVPAVYTLSKLGVEKYYNCLLELGFKSLEKNGLEAELGLALGAGEVTLKELVTAFSVFARDGKYIPLCHQEDELPLESESRQVYSPDSTRIICSILSDKKARVAGFGFSQTFETSYPAIFKTGTANQYQNIVALGATKDYTVGVWMGNHSGNTVMGKTGSSLPATIAKKTLDYLTNQISGNFNEPEEFEKINVCLLSGLIPNQYCPRTTMEYVDKYQVETFRKKCCDWHVMENGTVSTIYPAEFQKWHSSDFQNSKIKYSTMPLTIISPKNGSCFFASDNASEYQKISVEVAGGSDEALDLTVRLDDGSRFTVERPFFFTIPVTRGEHTLYVELEEEQAQIEFSVK